MADLKFIEKQNRTSKEQISNGDFTDYMFMMYRKGDDGWYKNTIMPVEEFRCMPIWAGAVCGITVTECVRAVLDKNGKISLPFLDDVIDSLNEKGRALGLPEADKIYSEYAIRELIRTEREFLKENSFFIVHITLSSGDMKAVYPVEKAVFTVNIEYREKEYKKGTSLICDICPVNELYPGTSEYGFALHRANAASQQMGYDRALLVDGFYKKYIKVSGFGNIFFRIGDDIITPLEKGGYMFNTAVLLMEEWGLNVIKRKISSDEIVDYYKNGQISEIFAVDEKEFITPVCLIDICDTVMEISEGKLSKKLYDSISNIERGILLSSALKTERI